MAKTSTLAELLRALSRQDLVEARRVAEVLVEDERRAGRHGAAARLSGAMSETGPLPQLQQAQTIDRAAFAGLSDVLAPMSPTRLASVELRDAERSALEQVVLEQRNRARLARHGLAPRSRLFFGGPPGTGKTLTARALGGELGWPIFVVRFDALLGAFLGQTGIKIREVFRFAEATQAILLLDEIDAIGRLRGRASDIGELDRVVISLMQQLDLVQPAGMIVAASNLPAAMDPALMRRFDLRLTFRAPTRTALRRFAGDEAHARGVHIVNGAKTALATAKTYADAVSIVEAEHRRAVLKGK